MYPPKHVTNSIFKSHQKDLGGFSLFVIKERDLVLFECRITGISLQSHGIDVGSFSLDGWISGNLKLMF